MPRYPTPGEYQEALQFPDTAFTDPELKAGEPELNPLGLPQAVTGAFAAVFPVNTPEGRYAVKCFLSDVPDQQARYRAVSRYLGTGKADPIRPHLVPFDFQPKGIWVGGDSFPLLKMGWADGVALNPFVGAHAAEQETLLTLAERWAELMERLEASGVAHGDLQHGNVLVAGEEGGGYRLILVDYDTLFVPPLKGRRSPEAGHRNYQHPDRSPRDFGPWLDRFSGLAIYTALRACALDPSLWERYDTGENLLFRAADFYDPASSYLFKDLSALHEIGDLVEALRTACHLDPAAVPSPAEVRSGVRVSRTVRSTMRSARSAADAERRGLAEERTLLATVFLPAMLLWTAATIALAISGYGSGALAALAAGLLLGAATSGLGYLNQSTIRRSKRLLTEAAFFDRAVKRLQGEITTLQEDRQKVTDGIGNLREERLAALRDELLEDRLKRHFVSEVAAIPGMPHRMVVKLKLHGIRTAWHATPARLKLLPEVSEATRTRVESWRSGLVSQYGHDLPTQLSPAEERRLQRYIQQRLDALLVEEARLREKIAVQEKERAEVLARRAELPELSYGRYLRYLLHLTKLPPSTIAPPTPLNTPPPNGTPKRLSPAPDEMPWWRQDSEVL